MSSKRGHSVDVYEKCSPLAGGVGFTKIGNFVSTRRAGKFLGISGSMVGKYLESGETFKDKYKFLAS